MLLAFLKYFPVLQLPELHSTFRAFMVTRGNLNRIQAILGILSVIM